MARINKVFVAFTNQKPIGIFSMIVIKPRNLISDKATKMEKKQGN